MANDYITIKTSDGTQKRYKAIAYKPMFQKSQSADHTVDGKLDVTAGFTYQAMRYVLRVPYQTTDPAFGVYQNLIDAFKLCNPTATPSNVFELTDHLNHKYPACWFMGDMAPEPLTTIIDGEYGWYMIPVDIQVTD